MFWVPCFYGLRNAGGDSGQSVSVEKNANQPFGQPLGQSFDQACGQPLSQGKHGTMIPCFGACQWQACYYVAMVCVPCYHVRKKSTGDKHGTMSPWFETGQKYWWQKLYYVTMFWVPCFYGLSSASCPEWGYKNKNIKKCVSPFRVYFLPVAPSW